MLITTNRAYKHWSQIFNNDSILTSAILDRVLHHVDTVIIEGKSFRTKAEIDEAAADADARPARPEQVQQCAVSDEVAAYIAEALMQLAFEFETNHYAQIRRHYQSIAPEPDHDPSQLDLFRGQ